MNKKDIFKIDNYFIRFGIILLIMGTIGFLTTPDVFYDLAIEEGGEIIYEDFNGRTLEEVQLEKGDNAKISTTKLPIISTTMMFSGLILLIVGIFFRRHEKKIIAIWDALERTKAGNVNDMVVSLGLSRNFILFRGSQSGN